MSYSFVVAGGVKKDGIQAVIERPELYQVSVNGKRIDPVKGKWWLDKVFGVFDIGRFVVEGDNRIVLKSSPFTIHTKSSRCSFWAILRSRFGKKDLA